MFKADADQVSAWENTLEYYRRRGGVLFLSYCRFWEQHGFVQQALAQRLVQNGVRVIWFDGSDWRAYRPVIMEPNENLIVSQLPAVPGRRIEFFARLDRRAKAALLRRTIRKMGGNPVIWVQAGLDEGVAADLPYIDVFSVFDDPYRHEADGPLCQKAKVIVTQNQKAFSLLEPALRGKVHVLHPPIDMLDSALGSPAEVFLPAGFPEKIMGYVGSFFYDGFDFELFEKFVHAFPDWGFVLMGRTDVEGQECLARWKSLKNFHHFPWVPRNQVASVWKKIRLTLLFYRANTTQDGAFPVKLVEGLRYGVPAIATDVPKTADLEGLFPRSSDFEELKASVDKALSIAPIDLREIYRNFAAEMEPRAHLSAVAQWLRPPLEHTTKEREPFPASW